MVTCEGMKWIVNNKSKFGSGDIIKCRKCGGLLPYTKEFFDGHSGHRCRKCANETRLANYHKKHGKGGIWKKKHPDDKVSKAGTKHGYRITVGERRRLHNSTCEGCGAPPPCFVDHCHDTGFVRGALCNGCNSALGHLKDSPERMKKLLKYMEKHSKLRMP